MNEKKRRKLTDNLGLKMIALLLSILIWVGVTNTNDPIQTKLFTDVQINIVNEDSIADIGKVIEPEGTGTVTLKVRERRSVLRRLASNGSNFYVEADLENITALDTVPLTVACDYQGVTWDEIEVMPSSLKFTLEDKIEQAFPVTISVNGEPDSDYAVGTTEIEEGKTILIAGPKSVINIIGSVSAPVTVGGMRSDSVQTSVLKVSDKNGAAFTDSQLALLEFKDSNGSLLTDRQVTVNVNLWKVHRDIPIEVKTSGSPAEGYFVAKAETIPVYLSLAGTDEAFAALGSSLKVQDPIGVDGASEDVDGEIDLKDTLSALGDIRLLSGEDSTISVHVDIEKRGNRTFEIPLSEIETTGMPQNMKLVFTPADHITVSIGSAGNGLSMLSQDEIHASMDLSVCKEEGSFTVPVEIEIPDGYILNEKVTITVVSSSQNQLSGGRTDAGEDGEKETRTSAEAESEETSEIAIGENSGTEKVEDMTEQEERDLQ